LKEENGDYWVAMSKEMKTLIQAVEREVMEESGYKIKDIKLLMIRDNPDRPKEDRQNIAFVFTCEALEKEGDSDWEVDDEKWFDLSNIPAKDEIAFDHYDNIKFYLDSKV
jgi:8-oxo-dGTP diphosphatase